jgi:hypothetical protein
VIEYMDETLNSRRALTRTLADAKTQIPETLDGVRNGGGAGHIDSAGDATSW